MENIEKIKLQMRILEFTQKELAKLINCDPRTLSNFLHGKSGLNSNFLFPLLKILKLKIYVEALG